MQILKMNSSTHLLAVQLYVSDSKETTCLVSTAYLLKIDEDISSIISTSLMNCLMTGIFIQSSVYPFLATIHSNDLKLKDCYTP